MSETTLDLHKYTSLHDAMIALKSILENTEREYLSSRKPITINVITGQGLHSVNGIPVLKPAVEEYFKKNFYQYTPNGNGAFFVQINRGKDEYIEGEENPLSSVIEAIPPLATSFMMMYNSYFPTKDILKKCNSSCYPAGRYVEGQTSFDGPWCFADSSFTQQSIEQCLVPEHIRNYWHRPLHELYPPMNTMNCAFILSKYPLIRSLKDAYEWSKNPASDHNFHIKNEIIVPPIYNTSVLTLERVLYSAWKIFKQERNEFKKKVYADIYEDIKNFPNDIHETVTNFFKKLLDTHYNKKDAISFSYLNFINFNFIKGVIDMFCSTYETPHVCVQFQTEGFRLFLIDSILRLLNNAFEGQEEVVLSKINDKLKEKTIEPIIEETHQKNLHQKRNKKSKVMKGGSHRDRYIIIGDKHADLYALLRVLESAEVIRESKEGKITIEVANYKDIKRYDVIPGTHVICLGDLLDGYRKNHTVTIPKIVLENYKKKNSGIENLALLGENNLKGFLNEVEFSEMKILELLRCIEEAGNAVTIICGNHELMNLQEDFRYVSPMLIDKYIPCFSTKNTFVRYNQNPRYDSSTDSLEKQETYVNRNEYFLKGQKGFNLLMNKGKFNIAYKLITPKKEYFLMHGGIAKVLLRTANHSHFMKLESHNIKNPDTYNAIFLTCDSSRKKGKEHEICKGSDINLQFTEYLNSGKVSNDYIINLFEGESSIAWTRDQNNLRTCYEELGHDCSGNDYTGHNNENVTEHVNGLKKIFQLNENNDKDVATVCGHCIQNIGSTAYIPAKGVYNSKLQTLVLDTKNVYNYDSKKSLLPNNEDIHRNKILHIGANSVYYCEEIKDGVCKKGYNTHFRMDNACSGAFLKRNTYEQIINNMPPTIDILTSLPSCLEIISTATETKENIIRSLQTQYPTYQFSNELINSLVKEFSTTILLTKNDKNSS